MTEAEQMAEHLTACMPNTKVGALRFWDQWFGRPYDNCHRLIACTADGDLLRLRFDEEELLSVWSPRNLRVDKSTFLISNAAQVRWEWFLYGRPKIPANLYFMEFTNGDAGLSAKTNNWLKLNPDASFPAVEMP